MANYKEIAGPATTWTRANRIMISNPLEDIPKQISFFEETVVKLGDTIVKSDSGYLVTDYLPDMQVELLDPKSGESANKIITHAEIYQAIYSLYMQTAIARDIQLTIQSTK